MKSPRPPEPVTVLADANVLYAQNTRNIFMTLALEGLFRLRWTAQIEDEWVRNRAAALALAGKDSGAPLRTVAKMREVIPDHDPGDWRPFVPVTGRTHPKDTHVAAAAVACAPSVLVTWNIRDFDARHLKRLRVLVTDPDTFLCCVYDAEPDITCEAARRAYGYLRKRAGRPTWAEYLVRLAGSGKSKALPGFADRLRRHS